MELNEREKLIYDYLIQRKANGIMPTVREICRQTGITSTSVVHKILKQLEVFGYIERADNASRSITIKNFPSAVSVPLIGKVTAGEPIFAAENIEEYLPLPSTVAKGNGVFALRVKGFSMKNAGILDNDIIIADKNRTVQNGDIIVALIDNEATVKRLGSEGGKPVLYPENPEFSTIYPEKLVSLGKVIACYREF